MVEFLISLLPTFTPFYIQCSSCFLEHILGHADASQFLLFMVLEIYEGTTMAELDLWAKTHSSIG